MCSAEQFDRGFVEPLTLPWYAFGIGSQPGRSRKWVPKAQPLGRVRDSDQPVQLRVSVPEIRAQREGLTVRTEQAEANDRLEAFV